MELEEAYGSGSIHDIRDKTIAQMFENIIHGDKGANEMEEISIKKVMNGYIVHIGCERVVFNSIEILLQELGRYLLDPEKVTKEYVKKYTSQPDEQNE